MDFERTKVRGDLPLKAWIVALPVHAAILLKDQLVICLTVLFFVVTVSKERFMKVNFVFLLSLFASVACNVRVFGQEGGYDDEIVLFEIPVDSEEEGGEEGSAGAGTGSGNPKCFKYDSSNSLSCMQYVNTFNIPYGSGACGGCNWNASTQQYICASSNYFYTTPSASASSAYFVKQVFDGTGAKFLGNYNSVICYYEVHCGGLCISQDPNVPPNLADCPQSRTLYRIKEPKLEGSCP